MQSLHVGVILALLGIALANIGVPVVILQSTNAKLSDLPPSAVADTVTKEELRNMLNKLSPIPEVIVTFVQDKLCTEDFLEVDAAESGGDSFKNLKGNKNVAMHYYPSVKSPVDELQELSRKFDEQIVLKDSQKAVKFISESRISKNSAITIHLNPTADEQYLAKSLQSNDKIIGQVLDALKKSGKTYMAFYTALNHRKSSDTASPLVGRHLLAEKEPGVQKANEIVYKEPGVCLLYIKDLAVNDVPVTADDVTVECKNETFANGSTPYPITITPKDQNANFSQFTWSFSRRKDGHWSLDELSLDDQVMNKNDLKDFYIRAPKRFSYHCNTRHTKFFKNENTTVTMTSFQVQIAPEKDKFDNAYDCAGFFTIPIWTGIFLSLLLVAVTVFSLGMLSNISTFDQFDDPKGKPLLVNVSE